MKKQLLAVLLTITVASNMLVGCEGSAAAATTEVSTEAGVMTEASVEIPEGSSEGTTGTETESSEYKGSDTTGQIEESTTSEVDEKIAADFDAAEYLSNIPEYDGRPSIIINNNVPWFADGDITEDSFERYSDLDNLGRCGTATACIGEDIMPTESRGNIGMIKPTGWIQEKYPGIVDSEPPYLYNRCHLIGFQLTGENANERNLITGTRYMNVEGMLPYENIVADYVKSSGNHVMYRVTPVFEGDNLLCNGVLMEAYSVEDHGAGVQFCVYCPNVQPGISINFADGSNFANQVDAYSDDEYYEEENTADKEAAEESDSLSVSYIANVNSKKFHVPSCSSVADMKESNKWYFEGDREDLINQGYSPCNRCSP